MEGVKTSIQEILTNISDEDATSVAEHLCNEVGVESSDDLSLVEPADLPMLKKIQVRKLIQNWKKTSSTCKCCNGHHCGVVDSGFNCELNGGFQSVLHWPSRQWPVNHHI